MLSNNKIKYLKSLYRKKNRLQENKIIIEGIRIINEAISKNAEVEHIWINEKNKSNKYLEKLIDTCKLNKISFTFESEIHIKSISDTKNSQGVLALINIKEQYNSILKQFENRVIILDMISDPGNLGTIIRTCAWFGIDSLILTDNSADIFNPKCVRSGMGAHFYLKHFTYLGYDKIIAYLNSKKFTILRATLNAEKLDKNNFSDSWALILGSEAHGINPKLQIGQEISIPGKGNIESLNVSIACGIILNQLSN